MKNVRFTFLCLIAVLFAINVTAQDAVHGINGYYNYTAKQFESESKMELDGNGTKLAGWGPSLTYENDYLKVRMGVNNAEKKFDGDTQYFDFRTGVRLKETVSGQGQLTITKDFPIVAFKVSMPHNNERISGSDYLEPEFRWYNPETGVAEKAPLGGLDGNGRKRILESYPYLKDINGLDSVKFNTRIVDPATTADTTMWAYSVNDPLAGVVYFLDFSSIIPESGSYKTAGFSFGYFARADTAKTTPLYADPTNPQRITGYTASTEPKSLDQLPTYYFKWLRTFGSKAELEEFISHNNGDGNDPRSDNQLLLNTQLYHAKEFVKTYKFADESALNPFKAAVTAAETVYQSTPPNNDKESAEYKAWDQSVADAITSLSVAQGAFLEIIALELDDYYNTLKTADESYGIALGEETTIGSLTGRLLTVGAADAATGFVFNELGNVNGQRAYKLITAEGVVVVADNKSLMVVPVSAATATNTAVFIFSNRADSEWPNFDMKVGANYYYVADDNTLKYVDALPDAEAIDELFSYLFVVSEGAYDNSANESATNPGLLFAGWEFDQSSKTIDSGRLTLPEAERTRFDGWGLQRWRMYTRYNVEEKDGLSCLALRIAPQHYAFDDVTQATPVATGYPASPALARENGVFSTDPQRDPDGGVRDSTYIVYTNTYTKRYLAIKWGATSPDVTFGSLNFYMPQDKGNAVFNPANMEGQKGDVYYWDMLKLGVPYGDKGYCAQFMSFDGIPSADDVIYLDWIRTYATLDAIPEEKFSFTGNSIVDENADNNTVNIYSPLANTIEISNNVSENAVATVYSINGMLVAQKNFTSSVTIPVNQSGLYIVTVKSDNQVYVGKIIVR